MPNLKPQAARILAVILVLITWAAAQPTRLSAQAKAALASGFSFTKLPIPEPSEYSDGKAKSVRQVHPSLKRISAWISATGASIALGDIDGDSLDNDYCFIDPRTDAILVGCVPGTSERYPLIVLNPGKKLTDTTMAPMGALIGDLNEDGLQDILVYYWGRAPIAFLRQKGEISNTAFAPTELLPGKDRWFTCAVSQADLDGDGHKDLLVCNYFKDGSRILDARADGQEELHDSKSKSYNGGLKHFLLWQKDGTYREVQSNLPESVLRGWTVAAGTADLNGDLLPEIYLANDLGPDRLLLNQSTPGKLNFKTIEGKRDFTTPASSVLGCDSYKGMGVDFGDLNGDGQFDIYVSNIAAEYGFMESHFLWLSNPKSKNANQIPQYKQSSEDLNLSRSGWGWDARLADFNNDGQLEAFQATGFLKGKINRWPELQALGTGNDQMMHDARNWPSFKPGDDINGHESNAFFVKGSDGRFYNLNREVGLHEPTVSRGIAIADVDGDGDLDFAVANQWEPSFFYRNDTANKNRHLSLHLSEGPKNLTAIGAQAKLHYPDGRVQVAQVDGGSGHSGKRSSEIHFGLADTSATESLPVDLMWRDGQGKVHEEQRYFKPGKYLVHLESSFKGN